MFRTSSSNFGRFRIKLLQPVRCSRKDCTMWLPMLVASVLSTTQTVGPPATPPLELRGDVQGVHHHHQPPPPPPPPPPPLHRKHHHPEQCTKVTIHHTIACYNDSDWNRGPVGPVLPSYAPSASGKTLTLETCAVACNGMGLSVAGVDAGTSCFCGKASDLTPPSVGARGVPKTQCTGTPCEGNSKEGECMVLVFRWKFVLEDAISSHACSLEALACV
jgi:hypothetical protein